MIRLCLTGSIGMGKSTVSKMFRDLGVPVWDADATVHALYNGAAAYDIEAEFPGSSVDGKIDRNLLRPMVINDREAMKRLEAIVTPYLNSTRIRFEEDNSAEWLGVYDIPLYYENPAKFEVDFVAVVSCGEEEQRRRVLARPNMTDEIFERFKSMQASDTFKRSMADFIIDTSVSIDETRKQVEDLVQSLLGDM